MKAKFNKVCLKAYVKSTIAKENATNKIKRLLTSNIGASQHSDSSIQMLIGIIVGTSLLVGIAFIIGKSDASTGIMKMLKEKIEALFDYLP